MGISYLPRLGQGEAATGSGTVLQSSPRESRVLRPGCRNNFACLLLLPRPLYYCCVCWRSCICENIYIKVYIYVCFHIAISFQFISFIYAIFYVPIHSIWFSCFFLFY